jgi:hypothetical protein
MEVEGGVRMSGEDAEGEAGGLAFGVKESVGL